MESAEEVADVRFCKGCDTWREFNGRRRDARYHSDDCRYAHHHKKDKDWVWLKEQQVATLAEGSRLMGLSRSQILYRASRGQFSLQRVDGRIYVSRESISKYMETNRIQNASLVAVAERAIQSTDDADYTEGTGKFPISVPVGLSIH